MKNAIRLVYGNISLATLSLFIGFAWQGLWNIALLAAFLGLVWGLLRYRAWVKSDTLFFVVFLVFAAAGCWMRANNLAMLLAGVAVLGAWDLSRFLGRVRDIKPGIELDDLATRHNKRLATVQVVGFTLALLVLEAHFRLNFGMVFLIILVLVFSLSRSFRFLIWKSPG